MEWAGEKTVNHIGMFKPTFENLNILFGPDYGQKVSTICYKLNFGLNHVKSNIMPKGFLKSLLWKYLQF